MPRESAATSNPMCRAYCTPRCPRPPIPSTATRSPAFAGAFRSALNVVSPAHSSGRREAVRDRHEPARLCDHHLGISPIRMNAREFLVTTVHEIAISTEFAITARPCEEAGTHALTNRPALDTGPKGINSPDHFMPWHARPANWKEAFHRARIRVAYSACFDAHANLSGFWFTNR